MLAAYRSSGLARYVTAATLARSADGGAAVGLVLLAASPGAGLRDGARVGGLLSAGLTAPHLLGPCLARVLDRAPDGRRALAASFAAYALALAAGSFLLGRSPIVLAAAAVVVAGACGPLLTGGLSSRLAAIAGAGDRAQRRAEGWDAVTYGLAGTAGPAAVAALAALTTPLVAILALAGAALVAAALTLTLPRAEHRAAAAADALGVRAALRLIATHGPLRRVSVATMLTALTFGGLSVLAVVLGAALTSRPGAGATLVAAFGLGNLTGSLLVTAFPVRGEPETVTARWVAAMGAALALCATAPSYPLALAAFALAGASNAPFFTASLAARSRYSPPRARAQVFVSLAGLKVAMASAGTALAGAAIGLGPRALLAAGAVLTMAAAAATVLDRRLTQRPPATPTRRPETRSTA
jgi:predicted MFS family arabinose efflux permease